MDADGVLTVLIAVLALLLTGWGVFMPRPKRWHRVVFGLLGLLMLALIAVQAYRNSTAQQTLRNHLNIIQQNTERPSQVFGFLQLDKILVSTVSPPLLTLGARSIINVVYTNKGSQPVSGADQYSSLVTRSVTAPYRKLDAEVFEAFKARVKKLKVRERREGSVVGVGQGLSGSLATPEFTEQFLSQLLQGTVVIYILGHAYWDERPEGMYVCFRLQQPKDSPLKEVNTVWQACQIPKT